MSPFQRISRFLLRHAFVRFALVGAAGYVVNAGVLALDTDVWGMDFKSGIALSIFVSMIFTWAGNRYLTFYERRAKRFAGILQEWLKFMGANAIGAIVNYGVAILLAQYAPGPFDHKFVAQACGVLAGLVFNFTLSRTLVFRG